MSASQWLSNGMNRAANAPVRVEGIYTPVSSTGRTAVSARRTARVWSGTPEIYFTKNIDNSRLVKVSDGQRNREIAMFSASLACLFVVVMIFALQHFSAIEYGYKIEAQRKQRDELVDTNRALRLQEATLRDPERIDVLARRMGLQAPAAEQVQRLDSAGETSTPMLAQLSEDAAITATP